METTKTKEKIPNLWDIIEKEIVTTSADGKKLFNVPKIDMTMVLDKPIVVWDWEIGITTSKSTNDDRDRYIMLISFEDNLEEKKKIISSSKYILEVLKKVEDRFEGKTHEFGGTIVKVFLSQGKSSYKFKED